MADADTLLHPLLSGGVECVIVGDFAEAAHGLAPQPMNRPLSRPSATLSPAASGGEGRERGRLRFNGIKRDLDQGILNSNLELCCPFTPENLLRLTCALAALLRRKATPSRRSADFQSAVSQVFNLLGASVPRTFCRLQVGDTADWKSALRAKEAMGGPKDKLTLLQLKAIQERTQTH